MSSGLKQKKIIMLLIEASKKKCSSERRNDIYCILSKATDSSTKEGIKKIRGRRAGIRIILNSIYFKTIQENPSLLPKLFPFFVIACGKKNKSCIIPDKINWDLMMMK